MSLSRISIALVLLLAFSVGANAQSEGVAPVWDAQTMLKELVEQLNRFGPLLDQVSTAGWGDSSEAYAGQLQALKNEIGYLQRAANELSVKPGKLTKTLEVYLRMQAVQSMMASVIEGVRRHQNPAVADLLQGVTDEIGPYRQNVQEYLVELVGMKEAELKIANQEAQRCRSQLIQNR
jgi:hypothetical protein